MHGNYFQEHSAYADTSFALLSERDILHPFINLSFLIRTFSTTYARSTKSTTPGSTTDNNASARRHTSAMVATDTQYLGYNKCGITIQQMCVVYS